MVPVPALQITTAAPNYCHAPAAGPTLALAHPSALDCGGGRNYTNFKPKQGKPYNAPPSARQPAYLARADGY